MIPDRRQITSPSAAFVVHLFLLHSIFASNLRYRLPLEPILAALAGAGLWALARSARAKR